MGVERDLVSAFELLSVTGVCASLMLPLEMWWSSCCDLMLMCIILRVSPVLLELSIATCL